VTGFDALPPSALGLAVALGCGLLIGLERERRKGKGDARAAAGIRSFGVAALAGALARGVGSDALLLAGALLVAALATVSYFKSRSRDPGVTTELALFATYLVGVQAVQSPALGAACGVGLAVLLAARQSMHRFATQVLTEQELHDALMLAALALVLLPLVPRGPQAWLGGIAPQPLVWLVLLILLLQALGHVARRAWGERRGMAVSGFASGFISSTATIASLGRRVSAAGGRAGVATLAGSAVLSTAATWAQVLLMTAALSLEAAQALAPAAMAGLVVALAIGLGLLAGGVRSATTRPQHPAARSRSALRMRDALVAVVLSVVTLLVSVAQRQFGATGVLASVALAGLADAQSPVVSLTALFAAGRLDAHGLVTAVWVAVATNSGMRTVVAGLSGGRRFGCLVGAVLLLELGAAAGATWFAW
jgi:uncharacterized membrane protein (DUF4010 family)